MQANRLDFVTYFMKSSKNLMGMETLTIKGDLLETNFQCFFQKGLHWRPRSPMETSVAISAYSNEVKGYPETKMMIDKT